jgi:hypothetical protein
MKKSPKLITACFVFDGWDETPMRSECHGLFSEFEELIRTLPECPEIFGWIPTIWQRNGTGKGLDSMETGTALGTVLEATYYPEHVTPEQIEQFFSDYQIRVHRDAPFLKPAKNILSFSLPRLFRKK